jgi:hypothetical protein
MLIITNRLEWVCDRCDSSVAQQTVSVIYADGTDGYLCRRHLGEVIREQCGERVEEECPI